MSSSPPTFTTVAEYAAALAEDPYVFDLTDSMTALCGPASGSNYENEFKDVPKKPKLGMGITKVSNIKITESTTPFPLVNGATSDFPIQQNLPVSPSHPMMYRFPPLTPTSIANNHPLRHVVKSRKLGNNQSSMCEAANHGHNHDNNNNDTSIAATDPEQNEEGQSSIDRVKDFGKRMLKKVKGDMNTSPGKITGGSDATGKVV